MSMSTPPLRLQRRRSKGSRLPEGTICVTRPGRWSNPYSPHPAIREEWLSAPAVSAADCVRFFRQILTDRLAPGHAWSDQTRAALEELRGHNLACWCHLCPAHADGKPLGITCTACAPCHADVLLELSNGPIAIARTSTGTDQADARHDRRDTEMGDS